MVVAMTSLVVGFGFGRWSSNNEIKQQHIRVLPNGLPRACCEDDGDKSSSSSPSSVANASLSHPPQQSRLPQVLAKLCGPENVIDGMVPTTHNAPFLKGARLGHGAALCIVMPRTLREVLSSVEAILAAECAIIPQGQNTGLTGGSVPRHPEEHSASQEPQQQPRPAVILSMKHINAIFPIDKGERVVCMAGAGLAQLQRFYDMHFNERESHSTLGSTFLNPTTAAGVALGSGGTQCSRKGPAYTDRALYLKITKNKFGEYAVHIINTLDVDELDDERYQEERLRIYEPRNRVLKKLDQYQKDVQDGFKRPMLQSSKGRPLRMAHDVTYTQRLCCNDESEDVNAVSRYNADTRGGECNRSEGKVIILATVHDSFPRPTETRTFWLAFDSLETAYAFRQQVALADAQDVPLSCEYLDRDAFDVIDRSGRLMGHFIRFLGTSSSLLRTGWNTKLWIEALPVSFAPVLVDKCLYLVNPVLPAILPSNIMKLGRSMDHHVAVTIGGFGNDDEQSIERFMKRLQAFRESMGDTRVKVIECKESHAKSITAFRFVAAPAFRTWCIGQGVQGFSVDYALPKRGIRPNQEQNIVPALPVQPLKRMRYSHFACNVVHEDLAFDSTVQNITEIKHDLKKAVEHDCGGRLPAEHGHGTEYAAPPETQERWKAMDPCNVLNPGIGGTSRNLGYRD
jgi:D-lactate dehydrogenase